MLIKKGVMWPTVARLLAFVVLLPLSQGLAGEAEKKEPAAPEQKMEAPAATQGPAEKPAKPEQPAGYVGTIVAVVPHSRTLVVDVPLKGDVLRVGMEVTKRTKIRSGGSPIALEDLQVGARVRINFRRIADGDEAMTVEVLRPSAG